MSRSHRREEGNNGKVDVVRAVACIFSMNQIQMQTRGEGVKKSENFTDIISGRSLIIALNSAGPP